MQLVLEYIIWYFSRISAYAQLTKTRYFDALPFFLESCVEYNYPTILYTHQPISST